jgi:hypothetical protein
MLDLQMMPSASKFMNFAFPDASYLASSRRNGNAKRGPVVIK